MKKTLTLLFLPVKYGQFSAEIQFINTTEMILLNILTTSIPYPK